MAQLPNSANTILENTSEFATTESRRCLSCKNPSCVTGCPVGYDIPSFLSNVKCGNLDRAVGIVGHLFGETCGYICARDKQCKGHCVLNKKGCGIDVGAVERQVFTSHFPTVTRQDGALQGLKVAVVGGGVSGVTFAEQCYRHGADVTIYERHELLYTLKSIPNLRLPKETLQRIERAILSTDIRIEQRNIDADSLIKLQKNFDVVYLATGATLPRRLGIIGEELVTTADDFLRGNNFCDAIIIGGGNTAMDCAVINASKGNKTVVCYRRTRKEMPAFSKEVELAEKCGATFFYNLAPVSVNKVGNKLNVTFGKTVLTSQGNTAISQSTSYDQMLELQCDVLVAATGNTFDSSVFPTDKFIQTDEQGCVTGNLYAGGDATGKGLCVYAVADALKTFNAVYTKYKR